MAGWPAGGLRLIIIPTIAYPKGLSSRPSVAKMHEGGHYLLYHCLLALFIHLAADRQKGRIMFCASLLTADYRIRK